MNHQTKKTSKPKRMRLLALLLAASLIINLACITDYAKASGRKKAYSGDDYRIELTESSVWNEGCTVNAAIENVSQKQIRNWSVILTLKKGKISNAWNVDRKISGNSVVLSSKEYNMVLAENGETTFGFQLQGADLSDIESACLVTEAASVTKNLSFSYRETGSWQGHKIVEVTLTNTGTQTIKDWSVAFRMNGTIDNIWNSKVVSDDEGMFQIKNADYNAVIAAGASVTFGFQVSYSSAAFSGIKDIVLFGSEEKVTLETEKPTSVPTATAISTPTKTLEPLPTKTPELVPTSTPKESDAPAVTSVPTVTPKVETEEMEEGDAWFVSVENRDWNMDMIHANDPKVEQAKKTQQRKIKVTMLDSGINYSSEVNVVERKNFFDKETSCLYEDESGHGTAIAEILASDPKRAAQKFTNDITVDGTSYTYYDNTDTEEPEEEPKQEGTLKEGETTLFDLLDSGYEWTEGVNPNIELYSGKILDENNETTVDMLVEGINWAIQNQSDILCLSLGMQKGSDKLHGAIKRAKRAGMLIISAVGEDKQADYPAAYPEVLSVGMTDSMGKYVSAPAEVAAPGQDVISRGVFDSMQIFSGSSFAVPHVAGLASILWQNHPDKNADFIRGWIDVTCNKTSDMEDCEYGLVDCLYALESYKEYNSEVKENPQILKKIEKNIAAEKVMAAVDEIDNEAEVPVEEEMQKMHGNWHRDFHKNFVSGKYADNYVKIQKYIDIIKQGIYFVDDEKKNPDCYGMHKHPWFHGYIEGNVTINGKDAKKASNYMASVRGLVEMADYMRKYGEVKKLEAPVSTTSVVFALTGINAAFEKDGKIGSQTWKEINANCAKVNGKVPKDCRSLLIYGMAMHTLTDTFSHSSYVVKKTKDKKTKKKRYEWVRLTHANSASKDYADRTDNHQLRFDAARVAAHKALKRILVDPKEGLTGYTDINKTADLYASTKEFSKLKKMMKIYNGEKEPTDSFKLRYTKDAFSLSRFSQYYQADKEITHHSSTDLEKYIDIVDMQHLKKTKDGVKVLQLKTDKSQKLKVYCGSTLEYTTQNESQNPIMLFINKEQNYTVKDEQDRVLYTIKNGEIYDTLSRKLDIYQDTTEDVPDSEEEDEINILCEIDDVCPSKECVLEGKIVEFSERSYSIGSFDDMPGLSDVTVSLTSRKNGKTYTAITDENGKYKIQLPKGMYDVFVQKDATYTVEKQYLKLMQDKVINKTLMLMSEDWMDEGIVDGYVYTTAGKALANAKVEVYSGVDYTEADEPEMILYTDSKGYFNTDFMFSGGYTFVISKEGYKKQSVYQPVIGYVQSTIKRIKMRRENNG